MKCNDTDNSRVVWIGEIFGRKWIFPDDTVLKAGTFLSFSIHFYLGQWRHLNLIEVRVARAPYKSNRSSCAAENDEKSERGNSIPFSKWHRPFAISYFSIGMTQLVGSSWARSPWDEFKEKNISISTIFHVNASGGVRSMCSRLIQSICHSIILLPTQSCIQSHTPIQLFSINFHVIFHRIQIKTKWIFCKTRSNRGWFFFSLFLRFFASFLRHMKIKLLPVSLRFQLNSFIIITCGF